MGKPAKNILHATKQKHPKNKKSKVTILFDESERDTFLKGFRKRKQERKRVANEKIIEKLKEEKRQLKLKKREDLNEKWEKLNLQLDFEHITEPKVYDLAKHTVTVTDVSTVDLASTAGLRLGANQEEESESEQEAAAEGSADESSDGEIFGRRPQPVKEESESEEDEENADTDKKQKRKFNPKMHKNLTHLMSKKNLAKARKKKKLAAKLPSHMREAGTNKKNKKKPRNARG